jgi:hypothetical protein
MSGKKLRPTDPEKIANPALLQAIEVTRSVVMDIHE